MKPHVVCHMISSIDGRVLPSRWTRSPDGSREDWSASYATVHEKLDGDAWIVGRVTMAEMTRTAPHAPALYPPPDRQRHWISRAPPERARTECSAEPIGNHPRAVILDRHDVPMARSDL